MKVSKGHIFNLFDTNGRRNDVIAAMRGYLSILNTIRANQDLPWRAMPNSPAQVLFYRHAIGMFPDVFKDHPKYDELISTIHEYPALEAAIDRADMEWLESHGDEYANVDINFDEGVEDRARHYTSNLVKLGFADGRRNISPVGNILLDRIPLHEDGLERLLSLNKENILYLRQLLKLRIFDKAGERYYAPFVMGVYALLRKSRLSEDDFFGMVQGSSPYSNIDDVDRYIDNFSVEGQLHNHAVSTPDEINIDQQLTYDVFKQYFLNRKSARTVNIYYGFYQCIFEFTVDRTPEKLDLLLTYYESNRSVLNKAFGFGRNVFDTRTGDRPDVQDFLDENEDMFSSDINDYLYRQFAISKFWDTLREYSDTTKRIFKASGLISFENGYVELAYHELCACIFNAADLKPKIFGSMDDEVVPYYESYDEYEEGVSSYFCSNFSLCDILGLQESLDEIKEHISEAFGGAAPEDIPDITRRRRWEEFEVFVANQYPVERVKELLALFGDRNNDKRIKQEVCEDATVPTIYEFIVGLAWYYFSGKRFNLLSSYNLTLSADFEPLNHAGGGQGDIVIESKHDVTMLEATLMNVNSQKRGEREPVLRHSVNLKVDEEARKTDRRVTTFFIADVFDANTINIWKAVASVPLQSTTAGAAYTDNVVIMPISSLELCGLMDRSSQYDTVMQRVHDLFEVDKSNFDLQWRDKFIDEIV